MDRLFETWRHWRAALRKGRRSRPLLLHYRDDITIDTVIFVVNMIMRTTIAITFPQSLSPL